MIFYKVLTIYQSKKQFQSRNVPRSSLKLLCYSQKKWIIRCSLLLGTKKIFFLSLKASAAPSLTTTTVCVCPSKTHSVNHLYDPPILCISLILLMQQRHSLRKCSPEMPLYNGKALCFACLLLLETLKQNNRNPQLSLSLICQNKFRSLNYFVCRELLSWRQVHSKMLAVMC